MTDKDKLAQLVALGSGPHLLQAQHRAALLLLHETGLVFPKDGCAITLSVLLQDAGIDVDDTYGALDLVNVLKARKWQVVAKGQQQAGDIGTTCGAHAHHGVDHIYLVLQAVNADEMVIADNQADHPHFRFVSGKGGKSPTTYFLRAT